MPVREIAPPMDRGLLNPANGVPIYASVTNDRVNVGTASNVVVGRVTRNLGTISWTREAIGGSVAAAARDRVVGSPVTHFQIEVLSSIKGNLSGQMVLEQAGGIRDGVLWRQVSTTEDQNGAGLLEVGSTYILFTAGFQSEARLQGYARLGIEPEKVERMVTLLPQSERRILISTNAALSPKELLEIAQPRLALLQAAAPNQISAQMLGR